MNDINWENTEGKWSVALRGYHKGRYYIQNKVTGNTVHFTLEEPVVEDGLIQAGDIGFSVDEYKIHKVTGWEVRTVPGDVVAFRPYYLRDKWTQMERKHFLITTINCTLTRKQMEGGVCEHNWDTNSYDEYNPDSFTLWNNKLISRAARAKNPARARRVLHKMDKQREYDTYIDFEKQRCVYPKKYFNKRRFGFTLQDLAEHGVDVDRMLNRNLMYDPQPEIKHTLLLDKLRKRYASSTDGFNHIARKEL